MICQHCAAGADLKQPHRHSACKGCDCQHFGTPFYVRPDSTPVGRPSPIEPPKRKTRKVKK